MASPDSAPLTDREMRETLNTLSEAVRKLAEIAVIANDPRAVRQRIQLEVLIARMKLNERAYLGGGS